MVLGLLMLVYVIFGGMLATIWVQITNAVLLLAGGTILMLMGLNRFSFETLAAQAVAVYPSCVQIMGPSTLLADPINAVSLSLGLVFGITGLPHILMRFFTVPNAKEACKSVLFATVFIGFFFLVVCILDYTVIVIVDTDPQYYVDCTRSTNSLLYSSPAEPGSVTGLPMFSMDFRTGRAPRFRRRHHIREGLLVRPLPGRTPFGTSLYASLDWLLDDVCMRFTCVSCTRSSLAPLRHDAGRFSLCSRFDLPKIGGYIVSRV